MDGEHTHGELKDQITELESKVEILEGEVPPGLDTKLADFEDRLKAIESKLGLV